MSWLGHQHAQRRCISRLNNGCERSIARLAGITPSPSVRADGHVLRYLFPVCELNQARASPACGRWPVGRVQVERSPGGAESGYFQAAIGFRRGVDAHAQLFLRRT